MKKIKRQWFMILALGYWLISLSSAVQAAAKPPDIRVGLWLNQTHVVVSAPEPFAVVDSASQRVVTTFAANQAMTAAVNNGKITINGKTIAAREISVAVNSDHNGALLQVNKRRYRGVIDMFPTHAGFGLTIVDVLPVEQYLYGVVGNEVSPDWPRETLKAQAVAARTYAMFNLGKYASDGFDVCATADCQLYGGRETETAKINRAVDDTCGLVLIYKGKVINAAFHSSGGGYTENSENVWGTYLPYLRGVRDFDQQTPRYHWEKQMTVQAVSDVLQQAGYPIGPLRTIVVSPLKAQPMPASPDRGISGRVKILRLTGATGSVQLSGAKLRSLLQLNSTLFDIKIISAVHGSPDLSPSGSRDVSVNNVTGGTDKRSEADTVVVFTGFGWGHGLGLSQWGAKVMADTAPLADGTYFKQILKHYYQGIEIKKYY